MSQFKVGDICVCRHRKVGLILKLQPKVSLGDQPLYVGISLEKDNFGGLWQSVDPTFLARFEDLQMPAGSKYRAVVKERLQNGI